MRIHGHAQDTYRKAYIGIRRISSIRHVLAIDATKTLVSALVLPKLDCCNYPFYGSQAYIVERRQKVQNSAARLIFQCRKHNNVSNLLYLCTGWPLRPA